MTAEPDDDLTPAQHEVLALLGAAPDERPEFDPAIADGLRALIGHGVEAPLAELPANVTSLFVNKHLLASVHGCEAAFLAGDDDEFAWTIANARGTITHKAVELLVNWHGPVHPAEVTDEILDRLPTRPDRLGDFVEALEPVERAELRAAVVAQVSQFVEAWPPLQAKWRPTVEASVRAEFGRLVLSGRTDLTVGHARGTRAGKVLIDLKTGGFSPTHVEDLRFYAVLETLRASVPPRLLATHYLESGVLYPERVTPELLESAARRIVDGVTALVELRSGRTPQKRPSVRCRWCPLRDECTEGLAWIDAADDW